ncbi:hypothetical protein SRABI98_00043 [Microbacterium sp. Bi98]|uniref:hypothetical protein n=1 Tax=Microbacterium sp. Bi98 TaxID=2821116 RepID=UPI001DB4A41D|nr:hypothetical protein [Microbacterium sp. Bi98]CAH0123855.1 hypothetical protein SRABI98_00043 [Microbacterium sp. Bi98]
MNDLVAPTAREVQDEPDAVRSAILAAMRRISLHQPIRVSVGATTVRDLAVEAAVGRHHLYQSHPDLRDRFKALIEGEAGISYDEAMDRLTRVKKELAQSRELQQKTRDEVRRWKATTEVLQRAVNVLQEELRQEQLKNARLTRRVDVAGLPAPNPIVLLRPETPPA